MLKAASLSTLTASVFRRFLLLTSSSARHTHLEGKELEFKVIKLDQKRNNVVVSRRSVWKRELRRA